MPIASSVFFKPFLYANTIAKDMTSIIAKLRKTSYACGPPLESPDTIHTPPNIADIITSVVSTNAKIGIHIFSP